MTTPHRFTLGVEAEKYVLPHPRFDPSVILLIRRVIIRAFEKLREEQIVLADLSEDQVTANLVHVINNNLRITGEIQGFSRKFYQEVVRGGQKSTSDGACVTKTPDLCFRFQDYDSEPAPVIPEFNGLFIECKVVDKNHKLGDSYCNEGIKRFVSGFYAWAMEDGVMLAYVRHSKTIAGHLIPFMSKERQMTSLATLQAPVIYSVHAAAATADAEAIHTSKHRRDRPWPDGKGQPTDITIYHLWHRCTN